MSLAGCAAYRAAPLDAQRSADDFGMRRIDSAGVHAAVARLMPQAAVSWPPQEWDRALLLAVALTRNPHLGTARAEAQAAVAREIEAAQRPNPDVTLLSEYARHEPQPWLYGLSLNWLIRSSGRRRLDIKIARLRTSGAELALMERIWTVRRNLDAALSEMQGAQRGLVLLDRLSAAQDRLIALERRRIDAGEDPASELIVAAQTRAAMEQEAAHWRAAADAGRSRAAAALGLPPQALTGVRIAWPDWGAPPPVDGAMLHKIGERALLSRADLGIAIGEYAAAEARLKRAVARQYPQFTLGPGYYWDHGIAKFPLDLGFTLPLNRNRGEIAAARADRRVAAKRMLALQADIYGEIAAAEHAEAVARASVESAERRLGAARRQAEQADLAVRLGESGAERRLGAAIGLARARLGVVQMRAQLQNARDALEDALHAPLSGPELALSGTFYANQAGAGS